MKIENETQAEAATEISANVYPLLRLNSRWFMEN